MVIIFLLVILAFALLTTIYLNKNDFNTETLPVLFPAVGAILLSIYLGFKSVRIDAPYPETKKVTIAVLHDCSNGNVHSMIVHTFSDAMERGNKFKGLHKINEYKIFNDFKDMDVWNSLKTKSTEDPTDQVITILNLIEYAVLDWFSQPENFAGYQDAGNIYLIHGGGGGGFIPKNLVSVTVRRDKNEWNPFLLARDIELRLPKGSALYREKPNQPRIEFAINTKQSTIKVSVKDRASSRFEQTIGPVGEKIRSMLSLPERTPSLWVHGFRVEIQTRQKAFSRFSNQAKIEKNWLETVMTKLEQDFSWDLLRKHYEGS